MDVLVVILLAGWLCATLVCAFMSLVEVGACVVHAVTTPGTTPACAPLSRVSFWMRAIFAAASFAILIWRFDSKVAKLLAGFLAMLIAAMLCVRALAEYMAWFARRRVVSIASAIAFDEETSRPRTTAELVELVAAIGVFYRRGIRNNIRETIALITRERAQIEQDQAIRAGYEQAYDLANQAVRARAEAGSSFSIAEQPVPERIAKEAEQLVNETLGIKTTAKRLPTFDDLVRHVDSLPTEQAPPRRSP